MKGCKLSPVGLGLSMGVLWGLFILILGLLAHYQSLGKAWVETMNNIYVIYAPSIQGSLLGGLAAFVHAFVVGFLIAWLYNRFSCCGCSCRVGTKDKM